MFRLYLFVKRNSYPILFALLELVAISLIFSNSFYQRFKMLNSFQEVNGRIYERYRGLQQYFHLKDMNEDLVAENALLKHMLFKTKDIDVKDSNFHDTNANRVYLFIPAKIVNNTFQLRNNFLTLNRGSKHQIQPQMAVVTVNGVVGIVKSVSENYSLVISILNSDFMVNAKIMETGNIGSVSWNGHHADKVILKDIPGHVKVVKGQHVVVGPYSSLFPENTPIGTICDFKLSSTGAFYDISVLLGCDMRSLYYAYVVSKKDLPEQIKLEEEAAQ